MLAPMSTTFAEDGLIPLEILERVAPALRVLAHPVRLKLIELLMLERVAVGELAERAGVAPNVASQHLNALRAHGMVRAERDGKHVYYRVVGPEAVNLVECIRLHHT